MKPKMYRKTKTSKGSDLIKYDNNSSGGRVEMVISPETSVGQLEGPCIAHPSTEQGEKKLERT